MKITTRYLTQAGIIAALYAALTLALAPISYGQLQFRVSEALTLLPVLTPAAVPGLTIGCLIANFIGAMMGVTTGLDIGIGTAASLIAAILTYMLRKRPLIAAAPPVIVNGIMVGWMLNFAFGLPLLPSMGYVALGELAICYTLGLILLYALKKLPERTFLS